MKELPVNWMLQFWGDEEMLEYKLLDYIQSAYNELDNQRLFPAWESVYEQYLQSKSFVLKLKELRGLQPLELVKPDWEKLQLEYQVKSHSGMEEFGVLLKRLEMALPLLRNVCKSSEALRKNINEAIEFESVGILVPNRKEGLLYLKNESQSRIDCWRYFTSVQMETQRSYSFLRTKFVGTYSQSLSQSFQSIRSKSTKEAGLDGLLFSSWLVHSKYPFPYFHTLKPIGVMRLAAELEL